MSLTRTIAGRSLRRRPARTLLSICGIALGIAVAVAVFVLDHNTVLGLSLPGLTEWKPALEVRAAPGVANPRADLAATEGVAGVSAYFQNEIVARRAQKLPTGEIHGASERVNESAPAGADKVNARLIALEAGSLDALDALRVTSGKGLSSPATEREALVGEELASALGLSVGDTLLLARPGRAPRQGCVDGEIRTLDSDTPATNEVPVEESFKVTGVLAREKLGRRSQGMVVVVDYAWGKELWRGADVQTVWWVRQDPKIDLDRLRASLAASFSYELNKSVVIGSASNERAFRNGVRLAGLLALVLGLYVIFHTLSLSIVERVREIATLHALGASRKQITRVFLVEAVMIVSAAAVLGIAAGLALARTWLVLGVTTLGMGHHIDAFDVPWVTVLSLAGLGVGVALAGAVYPLLRARNASPVAALRGEGAARASGVARGFHLFAAILLAVLLPGLYFVVVPVVGETQGVLVGAILAAVGVLALLVVLPLLVPSLLRALSNALARPLALMWTCSGRLAAFSIRDSGARIAVSTAAIALVAAAFVGLKGMTASLRGEIEVWAKEALITKVHLGALPDVSLAELRQKLAPYPGIRAIENGSARSYVPFLLLGMNIDELARFGPCHDDAALRAAFTQGQGVILSRQLARHLGYKVTDRVHVANASGVVQELTVLAISDAYGYFPHPDERLYGVVADTFSKRAFCIDTEHARDCAIVLEPGTDPDVVRTAVRALWPDHAGLRFETGPGLLNAHLVDIDRDFRLFDMILGLSAILAGMGVLNGLLLSALERSKELGVLKAIGTSARQIAGMVLCESCIVGLLGGLLGTALGALLTPVILRALEGLSGLDLPLVTAGRWLALVPAGALALALVAALYPILRMTRSSAVSAVRQG